ncbi:MAG: squalene/phytoene synthase family protein [Terricaulis sp.]
MSPDPALDADVRRFDEDRWLASRFAPEDARRRLVALCALNHEIARTAETVRQAAIGDIRLQWWRDAVAEVLAGKTPRVHPVVQTFAAANVETPFAHEVLDALIAARGADLEAAPFATWEALDTYVDAIAGGIMRLALTACGLGDGISQHAARAWGYTGLMRAGAHWQARGRSFLPPDGDPHEMLARARAAYAAARSVLHALPAAGFGAVGYVALVPGYLRALERGETERPLILRQVKLVAASATGRV